MIVRPATFFGVDFLLGTCAHTHTHHCQRIFPDDLQGVVLPQLEVQLLRSPVGLHVNLDRRQTLESQSDAVLGGDQVEHQSNVLARRVGVEGAEDAVSGVLGAFPAFSLRRGRNGSAPDDVELIGRVGVRSHDFPPEAAGVQPRPHRRPEEQKHLCCQHQVEDDSQKIVGCNVELG